MLNQTPSERLVDRKGHPYFLWDCEMTLDAFERAVDDPDPQVRAYFVGKLMRQAKPDDVFRFVSVGTIRRLWPRIEPYLGHTREFWSWLLQLWDTQGRGRR